MAIIGRVRSASGGGRVIGTYEDASSAIATSIAGVSVARGNDPGAEPRDAKPTRKQSRRTEIARNQASRVGSAPSTELLSRLRHQTMYMSM